MPNRTVSLRPGQLDKTEWKKAVAQPDALQSEHWLLAYEANHRLWLVTPAVANDKLFAAMEQGGVTFYEPNAQCTDVSRCGP